MYKISGRP